MRKPTWLALLCALCATAAFASCGDQEEQTTPLSGGTTSTGDTTTTGTATTSMSSGGGMGGMGMGGAGGMGGMGVGGMGGMGGMGTGGAGGGTVNAINGCADADFQPPVNPNNVVISFSGLSYTPQCLLIAPGTDVTFSGATGTDTFTLHPLVPGIVVNGVATPDASGPIQPTGPMNPPPSVTFNFPNAGDYPYYCDNHYIMGMFGAIRVQ